MERQSFTLEFTTEAVNLVRERGVAVSQTSRDLGLHVNVQCKWVRAQWREGIRVGARYDWTMRRLPGSSASWPTPRSSGTFWKKPSPSSRRNNLTGRGQLLRLE
jgi:Transposase